MRTLVLFLALTAACDDHGSPGSICHCSYDAPPSDQRKGTCDPLTQSGCNVGEKCNWIFDQLMPTVVGHIGCEPAGTVPIGNACGTPAVGPDLCIKGSECVDGTCRLICEPHGGQPTCDAMHACVARADLFVDGGNVVAAVCDPP